MDNRGLKKIWGEYRSTIVFLLLIVIFRSSVADWNTVPTGSMKPTIIEGDRIWVNKLAYDIKLPLTNISVFETGKPERGDIVVFNSKIADKRLVKRVVGLPGDDVRMVFNQLYINKEPVEYELINQDDHVLQFNEKFPKGNHLIQIIGQYPSHQSSFESLTIPEDHYLVLGDNRDNSADSRYFGFVPRQEIIGRARTVVISLDYDHFYLPRSDRYFLKI